MKRNISSYYKALLGFDWKLLRWIAQHSPVHYADMIRDRNQRLLDQLENKYDESSCYVALGCPHCSKNYPCHSCIYTACLKKHGTYNATRNATLSGAALGCTYIDFGPICLADVNDPGDAYQVVYSYRDACIHIRSKNADNREQVHAFLRAHIAWTDRKEWWGTKYKGIE